MKLRSSESTGGDAQQERLPGFLDRVIADYPEVWRAYRQLGDAAAAAGPLDAHSQRLVKLALAVGARSQGAVHSHARRALREGIPAAAAAADTAARRFLHRLVGRHGGAGLGARRDRRRRLVNSAQSAQPRTR